MWLLHFRLISLGGFCCLVILLIYFLNKHTICKKQYLPTIHPTPHALSPGVLEVGSVTLFVSAWRRTKANWSLWVVNLITDCNLPITSRFWGRFNQNGMEPEVIDVQYKHKWWTCGQRLALASFPGSHAPEREHWSCAGMESLVFFVTWKAPKVERR